MKVFSRPGWYIALVSLFFLGPLCAEVPPTDLNNYYQFPLSFGVQYQTVSPFGDYRSDFDVYDLSAEVRWPIPGLHVVQLTASGGLEQFSPRGNDKKWDHQDLYALLGGGYAYRFSKTFELGADLWLGASLSTFSKLFPDTGTVYNSNLLARTSAHLTLIPSFNFAVEISPVLSWRGSLGPLTDFDGFSLGIGVAAHFRLGDDPDSPKTVLRSLRLTVPNTTSVFPAMQSWYVKNPLAKIEVTNTENFPVKDVEITFLQKGFMDSPTTCTKIPELAPGEKREIPILASFNAEVFRNQGTTPLSGEITATYSAQGRAGDQRVSLGYDLHDKSAIIWDDDRKAAAFITPMDGALVNYGSYIRQISKDKIVPGYSETVQYACQLFYALGELGVLYQPKPLQPFDTVKGAVMALDSVNLPRDTLKSGTGDCSDLTVLYDTLLECVGIESAFITVPGHIYAAFHTKVPNRQFGDLNVARNMTISVGDSLWIPVEITMIGQASFLDAWRKAIDEWQAYEKNPSARGFYLTSQAHELYRSVGLKETDLGLQYGRKEPVVANATRDIGQLVDTIVEKYIASAKQTGTKEDLNRLGIRGPIRQV